MILSIARLAARTVTELAAAGRETVSSVVREARARVEAALSDGERVVAGPDVEEPPTAEEIAEAAEAHETARLLYNEGGRGKRAARKVLDRTPTGVYSGWSVTWVQPARRELDREAVEAVFAELGRPVPTRPAAPRIKLARVDQGDQGADVVELLAA